MTCVRGEAIAGDAQVAVGLASTSRPPHVAQSANRRGAPRPRLSPRDTSAGETSVAASRRRSRARVDRLRRWRDTTDHNYPHFRVQT